MNKGMAVLALIISMVLFVRLHERSRALPGCAPPPAIVGIGGAVRAPGVYILKNSPVSVFDAVEAAGGVPGVPACGMAEACSRETKELRGGDSIEMAVGESGAVSARFESLGGAARLTIGKKLDPNLADEEDLMLVPKMRKAFAETIVKRRQGRPWKNVAELEEISGVGPKTIRKWEKYLEVEPR